MSKIKKINPIFVEMSKADEVLLSFGTVGDICNKMKISRPIVDSAVCDLIRHKYGFDSVKTISKERFMRMSSRVQDSGKQIMIV